MFEAGLFGTIEDVLLGAGNAIERGGHAIGEMFLNTTSGKEDAVDTKIDPELSKRELKAASEWFSTIENRVIKKDGRFIPRFEEFMCDHFKDQPIFEHDMAKIMMRHTNSYNEMVSKISSFFHVPEAEVKNVIVRYCGSDSTSENKVSVGDIDINFDPTEYLKDDKGIRDNLMEYVVCNKDLLRFLDEGVSIKSGEDSTRVENISITIDTQKMIWNYLCKRPDEAVADSTEKTDNSGKMLLDKLNDQSSEIKKQFQDALVKAKTAALEEIHCLKEMAAFAKKKSEGRLTQADLEELERKLPVWKKCLLKAKCDVVDTFLTEDAESDNSGMEKTEITFKDFEEALHYVKEQISSL